MSCAGSLSMMCDDAARLHTATRSDSTRDGWRSLSQLGLLVIKAIPSIKGKHTTTIALYLDRSKLKFNWNLFCEKWVCWLISKLCDYFMHWKRPDNETVEYLPSDGLKCGLYIAVEVYADSILSLLWSNFNFVWQWARHFQSSFGGIEFNLFFHCHRLAASGVIMVHNMPIIAKPASLGQHTT